MRTLRQASETSSTVTSSVGDSASVAQASTATPSTGSKNVRRIETVILDEDEEDIWMVGTETYDLTYSDNDERWIMFKDPCESQGEAYFMGYEDLADGGSRPPKKGDNKVTKASLRRRR